MALSQTRQTRCQKSLSEKRKTQTPRLLFALAVQTTLLLSKRQVRLFVITYFLLSFLPLFADYLLPFPWSICRIVTSLEAVVVQLQDSCREARGEAVELRQENQRLQNALETLRQESRERDKYLRALWLAKKSGDESHLDDFPPPPPSYNAVNPNTGATSSSINTPVTTPHPQPLPYPGNTPETLDPRLQQQFAQDNSVAALQQNAYPDTTSATYSERSPVMTFMPHDGTTTNGRVNQQYTFNGMGGHVRDPTWNHNVNQTGASGAESVTGENGSASHSPAYIPSPTITSADAPYGPRYPGPSVLQTMDQVPYMISNGDRSISPATSSPHNGSASSVNSHFQQFVFPTADGQERNPDQEYHRRMAAAAAPELTLHGGTADVSYAMNRRRAATGPERPMLGGGMPPYRPEDPSVMGVTDSNRAGGVVPDSDQRGTRRRRGQGNGEQSSRSPSPPAHPPISSTLAVIKAQAFGALRRTRTRPKKATEGAAKMAMEVLEARGIGLGINSQGPSKRPRLSDDDGATL